jgi:plastocyanin
MSRRIAITVISLGLLALAWAAPPVALAGGGCHGGTGTVAVEASSSVVKIDGCTFAPTVDRVPAGTVVTFLNSGTGPHDITGTQQEWGSPTLEPGETWTMGFQKAGVYPYSCSLHPGMAGVVVVGGTAAVADDSSTALASSVGEGSSPADGGPTGVAVVAGTVGVAFGLFGIAAFAARRRTVES